MILEIFHHSQADVALVASVCQRWRYLALACSDLWTNILINPMWPSSIALATLHAERSRDCFVNVAIEVREDEVRRRGISPALYKSYLMQTSKALVSIAPRTRRLVIDHTVMSIILGQVPHKFSKLICLKLQYRNGMGVIELFPSHVWVPELKELELTNNPWFTANALRNDSLIYSSITTLRLSVCSIRAVMMMLVRCTRVETLQLTDVYVFDTLFTIDVENVDWEMTGLTDGVLHYPTLHSLTIKIDESTMQTLFQHTQFPNLQQLRIERKSAQFMQNTTAELWRPTLRNVRLLSMGGLVVPTHWFSGFESVKVVRLLKWKRVTDEGIESLVELFPESVELLQLEEEVLWRKDSATSS